MNHRSLFTSFIRPFNAFLSSLSLRLGLAFCSLGLSLPLASLAQAQSGFGFVQSNSQPAFGSNSFGSASNWVNGFSQALIQVPAFQQAPGSIPQLTSTRRNFQLGANIQNRLTGVEILQVLPGSVAQNIGFQAGDVIVNVEGYQVGIVKDRIFDVVEEIQRRMEMSSQGVNILVFRNQTRQLENVRLDMNAVAGPSLTGSIAIQTNQALPQGTTLRVELKNISQPYQQISGGVDLRSVSGYGPFPYVLYLDPRYINPNDQYQIIASLSSYQGQTLLQGVQNIPAPIGNLPPVNITMQSFNPVVQASGTTTIASYLPNPNLVHEEFRRIFNRPADPNELQAWTNSLGRGVSIDSMRMQLLASPQFYDMSGNSNVGFARNLLQVAQNRVPSDQDVSAVVTMLLSNPSRQAVVSQVLASVRR